MSLGHRRHPLGAVISCCNGSSGLYKIPKLHIVLFTQRTLPFPVDFTLLKVMGQCWLWQHLTGILVKQWKMPLLPNDGGFFYRSSPCRNLSCTTVFCQRLPSLCQIGFTYAHTCLSCRLSASWNSYYIKILSVCDGTPKLTSTSHMIPLGKA